MSKGLEALKSMWLYIDEPTKRKFALQDYKIIEKELKALEIIKVLFKDRVRLYTRNNGIEQVIDRNGYYRKAGCVVYILEFHNYNLHYEFHLRKEEYDLLKEML